MSHPMILQPKLSDST